MELDDCGRELRLVFNHGCTEYTSTVEPVMVIKAPRGSLVIFSSPSRLCDDDRSIIIEQGNQCESIKAFMEQHKQD